MAINCSLTTSDQLLSVLCQLIYRFRFRDPDFAATLGRAHE